MARLREVGVWSRAVYYKVHAWVNSAISFLLPVQAIRDLRSPQKSFRWELCHMEARNEPPWAEGATWPWTSSRQKYSIETLPMNKSSCSQEKENLWSTDNTVVLCSWPQIYILEPGHHTFWTFSILLSESRSDEQSRGSCRQTELAKILSQTEPSVLLTYLKCMPSANTELVRGRLTMMTRIALTW